MKRNLVFWISIVFFILGTFALRVTPVLFQETGCENVLFPMLCMRVTQGPYFKCSHPRQNALDLAGIDKGRDNVYAPFSGTIKHIDKKYGAVWLESNRLVRYADGTVDYLTVLFMHDSDISDLYVGQIINQGEVFYQEGGRGPRGSKQFPNHLHIECMKGKVGDKGWKARGDLYCYNVFFIQQNTIVKKDGSYSWRKIQMPPKPGTAFITVSKSAYEFSDKVTFMWKAATNTTDYEIELYCEDKLFWKISDIHDLSYSLNLPLGNYTAKICSVNSHFIDWCTEGNTISFVVY